MFKEQKTSPYAKMYLVTPAIYERLKKCIDGDELKKIHQDTFGETNEEPKSLSDTVIQNIATEEIAPQEPNVQVMDDIAHDPPIEHLEPVPGPSSRPYHLFTDPQGNEYRVPDPSFSTNKKRKFNDNNDFEQPTNITELKDTGVQTDSYNMMDKSTQFQPESNNAYTQTDITSEKLYVKKPIIDGKMCPNYPLLPLSKCKPKEKQVLEFNIDNTPSTTIEKLKPKLNHNVKLPMNNNIENISSIQQTFKPKVTLPLDDGYDYMKEISSRKIHKCGICKKEFKRKWSLTRHYQTVHKNFLVNLKQKKQGQLQPMLMYDNDINRTMIEEGFPAQDMSQDSDENIPDGPIRPIKRFSNKKNYIQQGFPPDFIEENIEEPMIDEPIRSRKRPLIKSKATPIQPKYRQMMEVGYKRKVDDAKLPEYQEKKLLRSERPRVKPKRYENWGL